MTTRTTTPARLLRLLSATWTAELPGDADPQDDLNGPMSAVRGAGSGNQAPDRPEDARGGRRRYQAIRRFGSTGGAGGT